MRIFLRQATSALSEGLPSLGKLAFMKTHQLFLSFCVEFQNSPLRAAANGYVIISIFTVIETVIVAALFYIRK